MSMKKSNSNLEKNLEKVKTKMNKMFSGFKLNQLKYDDLTEVNAKLLKEVEHLNGYVSQPAKIFTHSDGYDAFIFIGKSVYNFEIDLNALVAAKGFVDFLANLTLYMFEARNTLNFNIDVDPHEAEHANDVNEKHIQALSYLLYITNKLENASSEFRVQFVLKQGLKGYMGFLGDDKFVHANKQTGIVDPSENPIDLIDYIILNTDCLRSTCDDHRQVWRDLNSFNILLKIAKAKASTLFDAYKTISYIVDDKQIESSMNDMRTILKNISKLLVQCKSDFSDDLFDRQTIEIYFKGKPMACETQMYQDEDISVKMIGLLECLYKLSVNDKIKSELYFKYDMKSCLRVFLEKG